MLSSIYDVRKDENFRVTSYSSVKYRDIKVLKFIRLISGFLFLTALDHIQNFSFLSVYAYTTYYPYCLNLTLAFL